MLIKRHNMRSRSHIILTSPSRSRSLALPVPGCWWYHRAPGIAAWRKSTCRRTGSLPRRVPVPGWAGRAPGAGWAPGPGVPRPCSVKDRSSQHQRRGFGSCSWSQCLCVSPNEESVREARSFQHTVSDSSQGSLAGLRSQLVRVWCWATAVLSSRRGRQAGRQAGRQGASGDMLVVGCSLSLSPSLFLSSTEGRGEITGARVTRHLGKAGGEKEGGVGGEGCVMMMMMMMGGGGGGGGDGIWWWRSHLLPSGESSAVPPAARGANRAKKSGLCVHKEALSHHTRTAVATSCSMEGRMGLSASWENWLLEGLWLFAGGVVRRAICNKLFSDSVNSQQGLIIGNESTIGLWLWFFFSSTGTYTSLRALWGLHVICISPNVILKSSIGNPLSLVSSGLYNSWLTGARLYFAGCLDYEMDKSAVDMKSGLNVTQKKLLSEMCDVARALPAPRLVKDRNVTGPSRQGWTDRRRKQKPGTYYNACFQESVVTENVLKLFTAKRKIMLKAY